MALQPEYTHWFLRARLKTRQLLLLSAVAEEGNIHAAARLLNMTQPAASKLLKELEDVLEVPLFERLPRGMRPTWYGEAMIRHAREALASLNLAHEELMALKAGHFGQVGIGAITAPALALLPTAIAMVKRDQPSLRVVLEIETSPVLIEHLRQGRLDILVARFFAEEDKSNLRYEPLTGEPVCAVARPGHAFASAVGLKLDDVAAAGWIVPPAGSVLRHRFELMFQEAGLKPPSDVIETAALLFITRMLQQSDLLCVMAVEVARYYAAHGILSILPLEMPCHMDDFGLITRTDRQLSPGALLLMKALKTSSLPVYGRKLDGS
ncbi:MAG: LysR family transcriptional regulator [Gammaproteobacteria bacterium]|nr:LysR family transcriptional regulator [Gammaproteobacteria bacterium]MBU1444082.1 LysR family transcriptional regulator [Gammaproteobacteria bacterium]